MKKLLLITCFVSASFVTFAQSVQFGIKAGPNFSKLHTLFEDGNTMDIHSSINVLFNAGVFADVRFGKLSLRPGLNITGKGGKYNYNLIDEMGTAAGTGSDKISLTYLQLPVNILYHIPVAAGEFYFGAGPTIAYGLSGRSTSNQGGISSDINFGNDNDEYKPVEIALNGLAGFQLKNGVLLNVNYDLGLTDLGHNNGANSIKTTTLGLSIGYVFK